MHKKFVIGLIVAVLCLSGLLPNIITAQVEPLWAPAYQECIPEGPGDITELSVMGGNNWFAASSRYKDIPVYSNSLHEQALAVGGIGLDIASGVMTINPASRELGWRNQGLITIPKDGYILYGGREYIDEETGKHRRTEIRARYSDYVFGTGTDLYELEDTPQTQELGNRLHGIDSVSVTLNTAVNAIPVIKTGGKIFEGSIWKINPATGDEWQWHEIDDLQAGFKLNNGWCESVKVLVKLWVGSQTFYPVTPTEIVPGDVNDWVTIDASALIASGATGVILHIVIPGVSSLYVGVRKPGSTDDRHLDISYNSHQWTMIGVDTNRYFEAYVESTTDIDIYVVGYTVAGVTFKTNADDMSLSSIGDWYNVDCSTEAPSAVGLIWEVVAGDWNLDFGMRKEGSTDERYTRPVSPSWVGVIIGCDGSQVCEGKIEHTDVDFFLVGYVTDGATFNTNADDVSLGGTGTWTNLAALPANSNMGFIEVIDLTVGSYDYGLRKDGSGEDIYQMVYCHTWSIVECDDSQIIEGKIESTNVDFFVIGYSVEMEGPAVTTDAATNIEKTTATLNGDITALNDGNCTVRGLEWDTDSGEPYANDWHEDGSFGTGTFSHGLTGLTEGETYYYRAYATNSVGTGYGGEVTFKTLDLELWYTPVTIISGTTLVDREGSNDGTIYYGGRFGDSNSTTITVVDSELTQADDYWNAYTLKVVETTDHNAPEGEEATISDSTDDTGFPMTGAVADDGGSQTDETTEANSTATNDMTLLPATPAVDDAYYLGGSVQVTRNAVTIGTSGAGVWTVVWEYWDGDSWEAHSNVSDGTSGFTAAAGTYDVTYDKPSDWATTTVSGISAYWTRARVSVYTSITTQPLGTQSWSGENQLIMGALTAAVDSGDRYEIWNGTEILWGCFPEDITVEVSALVAYVTPVSEGAEGEAPEVYKAPPAQGFWWGTGGAVENLPLYPLFNNVATQLGWTPSVLYAASSIIVAIGVGAAVLLLTGSALGALGAVGIGMFAGTAIGVLEPWVVIVYGVFAVAWLYVSRSV